MLESAVDRSDAVPAKLGQVLEDTLGHAKSLLRAEVSLARRELASEIKAAYSSALVLVTGIMFVQAALSALGVVLVLAFGVGAASAVLVTGLAAVGLLLSIFALRSLDHRGLSRTSARLALDAQEVMETLK